MNNIQLPPPVFICTSAELATLVEQLHTESLIALDIESNGLYAYQERVCLIQLSTRQADYLIDPLAIEDMAPLGDLTTDPAIEVVFHAAEYDIIGLKRDFGFVFTTLFDTMFAARILGFQRVGLANLLDDYFGVQLDKRYQRADWRKRPIAAEQQRYAQMDTHFLPALRDLLYDELAARDGLAEAKEIFNEIACVEPPSQEFDEEGFWRIHGAYHLKPHQLACLRELYLWRERLAQRRDLPTFKIMSNSKLMRLAQSNPRSFHQLYSYRVLKPRTIQRYGYSILRALSRGRKTPPPRRPRRRRVDERVQNRHELLKEWRKARAAERGVESDIILPREAMWSIAHLNPQTIEDLGKIDELGPWRLKQYGHEILRVVSEESS